MTITEFMKQEAYSAEVRFHNGRLWYDSHKEEWVICRDEYHKRKTIFFCSTSEEEAVAKVIELTKL